MTTLSTLDLVNVTGGEAVSTSPEVGSFWFGRKPQPTTGNVAKSVSPEVGSFWTGSQRDEVDEDGVPYARSVSPNVGSFWTGR